MVEAVPVVGVAEQKLPKPWVGRTAVPPGSSSARRRTEAYCARVSCSVRSGLTRSVRPTAPNSIEPPVNTSAGSSPVPTAKETWCGVWPGVATVRTVIDATVRTSSPQTRVRS